MIADVSLEIRPLGERDYPACAALHRAAYPERSDPVEGWRETEAAAEIEGLPARWVATDGGDGAVAFGMLARAARVLEPPVLRMELVVSPLHQGHGIGEALLQRLEAVAERAAPVRLRTEVRAERAAAMAFLLHRGFVERMRGWEMRLELGPAERRRPAGPPLPESITLTTLAEERPIRPDCELRLYRLDTAIARDEPRLDPFEPQPFERFLAWLTGPAALPEACFIAREGERYVGLSVLRREARDPETLRQSITGVLPRYRRCGIASALKRRTIDYARARGFRRIVSGVAAGNDGMIALNERLGFRRHPGWVTLEKRLGG